MSDWAVVLMSGGKGLEVFGPFKCEEDANTWATENLKGHAWEVVTMETKRGS